MSTLVFVTNFCPHYRVATFQELTRRVGVDFYFYSRGEEEYWSSEHGVRGGRFSHSYLRGLTIFGTRITPLLPVRLLAGSYDASILSVGGVFALPAAYIASKLAHRPVILWSGIWGPMSGGLHRFTHSLLKQIYRGSDAIVVYGSHVRDYLVKIGIDDNKVFIAAHSVDNVHYSSDIPSSTVAGLKKELAIPEGVPVMLFLGRLVREKGIGVLLGALQEVESPDLHVLIVGSGPLLDDVRKIEREPEWQHRIHIIGHVSPEETIKYYAASDFLVLPSISTANFREPWGLVVNEAFNQGIPAIVSNAVGAAQGGLVLHEKTGLVVPERAIEDLAHAIDLLAGDMEFCNHLGKAARRHVGNWTNEKMVDGFMAALEFVGAL